MPRHKHPEKNIKIVKNVYKMKLRHSAVACTFCGHLHSSADEIKRLNSITYEKNVWWGKDNLEGKYIDTTMWKLDGSDVPVCDYCSESLGGVVRRYLKQQRYEVYYREVSKKLL